MIYGFDCDDTDLATAALCLYAVWRSRDQRRFKITPDVWSQVERFTKASAKRSTSLGRFIEALKPRLACGTLHPRWLAIGMKGLPTVAFGDGSFAELGSAQETQREFLTQALARCDQRRALDYLYRETSWVVLLVRDRLERERAVEARFGPLDQDVVGEETTTEEE